MCSEILDEFFEVPEKILSRLDPVVPGLRIADLQVASNIDGLVEVRGESCTLEVHGIGDLVDPRFDFSSRTAKDERFLEPRGAAWKGRVAKGFLSSGRPGSRS